MVLFVISVSVCQTASKSETNKLQKAHSSRKRSRRYTDLSCVLNVEAVGKQQGVICESACFIVVESN